MKGIYTSALLLLCSFCSVYGQTLEQARALFAQGEYAQAKPVFRKYAEAQPANGNYNYWYGVCCLQTGEPQAAIRPLETAVRRKVSGGQLQLARAYQATYRFEEAIELFEEYIAELNKRKRDATEAEQLLEKSRADLRMLKGVEEVCVVDSFVVDKETFLQAYKIGEEAGRLSTFAQFFAPPEAEHPGTVYQTEIGNKIYYAEPNEEGRLRICQRTRLQDEWGAAQPLPENINTGGNVNYPFLMADGQTLYYATDAAGLGGYDIFVTRYNTNTDTYLMPENAGMPFNSPYNDYMYVIDEYNDLGWFASDRYQPAGKVCIYVFVPNHSKQTYNYEATDPAQIARLAQLHALRDTWTDPEVVNRAQQRLQTVLHQRPQEQQATAFTFVVDDAITYHSLDDFRSAEAQALFRQFLQTQEEYNRLEERLTTMREQYAASSTQEKARLAPALLDLEQRLRQMYGELEAIQRKVRRIERQA